MQGARNHLGGAAQVFEVKPLVGALGVRFEHGARTGAINHAGLRAFAQRREAKSKIYAYEQAEAAALSPLEEAQFRKNKVAWTFFEAQPPGYRHQMNAVQHGTAAWQNW